MDQSIGWWRKTRHSWVTVGELRPIGFIRDAGLAEEEAQERTHCLGGQDGNGMSDLEATIC